ncbi:MAG: 2-hydroxychromene-2-carboxylate isomerase [Kiloniellales bacterium]|nr:2-hydroxychromene-2-carboxylate isomerase [Kiloniellales bacterium]
MAEAIDFYFDFSSPYGYLAAQRIDGMAKKLGRNAVWRPFLLGAVFKTTGSEPLLNIPMKGVYARTDLARTARRLGVAFKLPDPFPFPSIAACRAFYSLSDDNAEVAKDFAKALYWAAFGEGKDISSAQGVLAVASESGLDCDRLSEAIQTPEIKARLREEVEIAIGKGVFGSPFFIVDGEPFWGNDRLSDVESWIEKGGW